MMTHGIQSSHLVGGDVRSEAQIDAVGRYASEDETDSRLMEILTRVGE